MDATANRHRFTATADVLAFVLAGNAILTIESGHTGQRYTYRVRQPKTPGPHFVQLLTGPDNTSSYTFLGTIFEGREWRHSRKSPVSEKATSAVAWAWLWGLLVRGHELPEALGVWHEGRCGRCGRVLTTPESLERGVGPECQAKRAGL